MEGAIRQPDLAASVQRYQLAVDQAKVRLNLAVCPRGVADAGENDYNTEMTAAGMKLGVNKQVNPANKRAALN